MFDVINPPIIAINVMTTQMASSRSGVSHARA
jgi:hypothetical protein